MTRKRVLTVAVLLSWVLLGPMMMAFGGCLLMGALCDGALREYLRSGLSALAHDQPGLLARGRRAPERTPREHVQRTRATSKALRSRRVVRRNASPDSC